MTRALPQRVMRWVHVGGSPRRAVGFAGPCARSPVLPAWVRVYGARCRTMRDDGQKKAEGVRPRPYSFQSTSPHEEVKLYRCGSARGSLDRGSSRASFLLKLASPLQTVTVFWDEEHTCRYAKTLQRFFFVVESSRRRNVTGRGARSFFSRAPVQKINAVGRWRRGWIWHRCRPRLVVCGVLFPVLACLVLPAHVDLKERTPPSRSEVSPGARSEPEARMAHGISVSWGYREDDVAGFAG